MAVYELFNEKKIRIHFYQISAIFANRSIYISLDEMCEFGVNFFCLGYGISFSYYFTFSDFKWKWLKTYVLNVYILIEISKRHVTKGMKQKNLMLSIKQRGFFYSWRNIHPQSTGIQVICT